MQLEPSVDGLQSNDAPTFLPPNRFDVGYKREPDPVLAQLYSSLLPPTQQQSESSTKATGPSQLGDDWMDL